MSRVDDELMFHRVLSALLDNVRRMAQTNPYNEKLAELGLPPEKSKKDPRAALAEQIDKIQKALDEAFLLRLVAAFERMAYDRVATALGEARKAMTEHFSPQHPFSMAAAKLVRRDLEGLKQIEELMASYPAAAESKLRGLREHRNFVAHGGRLGRQSADDADLEGVHRTLVELMKAIDGR